MSDKVNDKMQQLKDRKRLADATTRYLEELATATVEQENALAKDMMSAAETLDFGGDI